MQDFLQLVGRHSSWGSGLHFQGRRGCIGGLCQTASYSVGYARSLCDTRSCMWCIAAGADRPRTALSPITSSRTHSKRTPTPSRSCSCLLVLSLSGLSPRNSHICCRTPPAPGWTHRSSACYTTTTLTSTRSRSLCCSSQRRRVRRSAARMPRLLALHHRLTCGGHPQSSHCSRNRSPLPCRCQWGCRRGVFHGCS